MFPEFRKLHRRTRLLYTGEGPQASNFTCFSPTRVEIVVIGIRSPKGGLFLNTAAVNLACQFMRPKEPGAAFLEQSSSIERKGSAVSSRRRRRQ